MADITKNQLHELTTTMKNVVGDDTKANDLMDSIIRLLSVPEDQFEILAPGIMQSYQQSLNNPNDKIALVQALNATGGKAEDVTEAFLTLSDEVDKTSLSKPKRDFLKEMLASIVNCINDTEGIAKRNVPVAIELCHPDAKIPQYSSIHDAGADVYAIEDITIKPGETKIIPTGFKIALPAGFAILVHPRSGLSAKTKMRIANSIGLCDAGFRDEYKLLIENIEPAIKDIS